MRIVTASAALLLLAAAPAAAEDTLATPSPAATAAEGVQVPDFKTQSWVVVDATNGDILAGQNYREQRPMASTLKTLTSLTLLPRLQYNSAYEAQPNETLTEGAHVGVLAGNRYTVDQLFHGMLMRSGNDAAVALADSYGYQRTIDAMNAEAQRIGATDTVAMSPNGLDRDGQVTTAADLAQIYRVAIQDPRLQEILTAKQAEFPSRPPVSPTEARNTYTIYNHDSLLNSDYPGFLGGKAGFTSQAGRTYVAGADQNGHRLVVALLGIGGGTTATAREVLDWSFANVDQLRPIEQLPEVSEAQDVTAEPAASTTEASDLAPMPLDEQTAAEVATVVQQAQSAAQQAEAASADIPTPESVSAKAVSVTKKAVTRADQAQAAAIEQVVAAAVAAADSAAGAAGVTSTDTVDTTVSSDSGTGVSAGVAVTTAPAVAQPIVANEQPPAERGFFASLFIGLLKAFMWMLLLLGIAVVALRIRAVRRQKARREAHERAMRQRAEGSDPEATTRPRDPARTP